ncbi:MAG: phosphodiesterase [Alphaproteobacteria bacterium]|nr:phosphodiesterase [Alphaproteobacteria bacterium]MBL0718253.1 phosphodiesterase [Alphaproteobacteria bacterium]
MQIISHRGYWLNTEEKNKESSFVRSFDNGFGTEIDLRENGGNIVISHDIPSGGEITFEEVLQTMRGRNLLLALNIKSDGLIDKILNLLDKYDHTNYFTFDMSIPDMVVQIEKGAKVFSPLSDLVNPAVLLDKSKGVWLDAFNSLWYREKEIDNLIDNGKQVCVVSSDLHKRFEELESQWQLLSRCKNYNSNDLILCTDSPIKAINFLKMEVKECK